MGAVGLARADERRESRVDSLGAGWNRGYDAYPSAQAGVAEIQRARLLSAAVGAIEEAGYGEATVARITARARVSRRTFYELFANSEECLIAVLENAIQRIEAELAQAGIAELPWRERVRQGLWVMLTFFDREPALARVCVVQSLRGSEAVLERRAEVLSRLASAIDEGRQENAREVVAPSLTAEGLVGAAHAIVYERLLKRSGEPLTGLFGELMGMIVLPYLGAAAARREQERQTPVSSDANPVIQEVAQAGHDPLEGVPMRLTYRTACALRCIAEAPGISNRLLGDRAGISDQGQASKLLARLERLGLAVNTKENGRAKGEANAWHLTSTGAQVAESIGAHFAPAEIV